MRRHQVLCACWTELVPGSFKTDSSLTKAEPISHFGSIPLITYFRKGKKHCTAVGRQQSEKT